MPVGLRWIKPALAWPCQSVVRSFQIGIWEGIMSDRDQGPNSSATPLLMPDFGYGTLIETGRLALDRWTHGIFECCSELSAFAMMRLQENLETWQAFGNCRAVDELMQCQSAFAQKAAADYMEEAGKLAGLMMEAANAVLRTERGQPAAPAPTGQAWNVTPSPAPQPPPQRPPARARSAAAARAPSDRDG
jgi:hypothetical protein